MHKIKGIIALDLDGTLLNSNKELSSVNLAALVKAAEAGWEIVPTTGRFFGGMPEFIRELPFVHYAITVNGGTVEKVGEKNIIYSAEIPCAQALEIMEYLDDKPVIYDAYLNNEAYMTQSHYDQVDEIIESAVIRKMFYDLRQPVPDLKEYLKGRGEDLQKTQFFAVDQKLRLELMAEIPKIFTGIVTSSSSPQNVEINHEFATKGIALKALAEYLELNAGDDCDASHTAREAKGDCENNEERETSRIKTIAFGDGLNDITMLKMADIGIAMGNACDEALAAADWVTADCDHDGVAVGIEKFCF